MKKRFFGKTKQGQDAFLYTFQNAKGITMSVTDLGATLQSATVPGK